jgi:hypothetical protein
MPSDNVDIATLISELDALKTPEEKQARVLEHLNKQKEKDPQVIGIPENASADGAEPCL